MTSVVLNVNMSKTGIQDFKLQEMISDSKPGYNDKVTQYAKAMHVMYGKIAFATFIRSSIPSLNRLKFRKLVVLGDDKTCSTL